jgi:hypothetical protein
VADSATIRMIAASGLLASMPDMVMTVPQDHSAVML